MKTKQLVLLLAVSLAVMSCRDEVSTVAGEYGYYLSGTLETVSPTDTASATMPNETGQLQIINLREADSILLVFTSFSSGVYQTRGTIQDKEIKLEPFTRSMRYDPKDYEVAVSGAGHVYDNTILFSLQYSGQSMDGEEKISSNHIECVAKRN